MGPRRQRRRGAARAHGTAPGPGDAHLDLEATLLDDGQISSLNVVPVDQASKKWLDLVIEGKQPGTDDGEVGDGRRPWRGAEMNLNVTRSRRWRLHDHMRVHALVNVTAVPRGP